VYALSDSSESALKQQCDHKHDQLCDQREALHATLQNIGEAVQDTTFHNEDERDEILFLYESAKRSIQSWKAHQLRSVRQDKSRLDIPEQLNTLLIVNANVLPMKFLPYSYRVLARVVR